MEWHPTRSTTDANVGRLAKEYTTPLQTYNKIPYNAMKLNPSGIKTPVSFSFLEESSDNAVLSTLKKAEKAEGFVLRFFNPTEGEVQSRFTFNPSVDQVQEGNLNEKALAPLKVENNQ